MGMQGQICSRDRKKGQPVIVPTWDTFLAQAPNLEAIADAMLCLQTGVSYGCPLRGSMSNWLRQIQLITAKHWTKLYEIVRGRTEGVEEYCNTILRTTESTNQSPQDSQELNHQPKSIHGLVCGPCYIYSRGLPCDPQWEGRCFLMCRLDSPEMGDAIGVKWQWMGWRGSSLLKDKWRVDMVVVRLLEGSGKGFYMWFWNVNK